jgi:SAM-dependent methyltransferase
MRKLVVPVLHRLAQSPTFCKVLDGSLVKAADFYKRFRLASVQGEDEQRFATLRASLAADLVVKHGPFAGMKYPGDKAAGSAFMPKMLGSYEQELHPILERLLAKNYRRVIDVGCAEGYYAVGIARRLSECQVIAYDLDATARNLCTAMAQANGVSDRVRVETFCSAELLAKDTSTDKTLLICDCEGYEKQLFNPAVRDAWRHQDILIEMHDFIDLSISSYLLDLFRESHQQTLISSIDDLHKARDYDYPELQGLSLPVRRQALAEDRPRIMEWLILEAK